MTRITPLLGRNEQFARAYSPIALGVPAAPLLVVCCLDHRVDPAIVLGLQLGGAPVIRNAGGASPRQSSMTSLTSPSWPNSCSMTKARSARSSRWRWSITRNAGRGFWRTLISGGRRPRRQGSPPWNWKPRRSPTRRTVQTDVERLLTSPLLSPKVSVSGHVYDVATGRVTTVLDARYP